LVGSGAPKLSNSPLRATAGVRQRLSDVVALELRGDVSLSGRPSLGASDPLVPIEPRVTVLAGLRLAFPFERPRAATITQTTPIATPSNPESPAAAKASAVAIHVVGEDGNAIPDAKVEIRVGDWSHPAVIAADGNYHADEVPAGDAVIAVTA